MKLHSWIKKKWVDYHLNHVAIPLKRQFLEINQPWYLLHFVTSEPLYLQDPETKTHLLKHIANDYTSLHALHKDFGYIAGCEKYIDDVGCIYNLAKNWPEADIQVLLDKLDEQEFYATYYWPKFISLPRVSEFLKTHPQYQSKNMMDAIMGNCCF